MTYRVLLLPRAKKFYATCDRPLAAKLKHNKLATPTHKAFVKPFIDPTHLSPSVRDFG